MVRCKHNFVYTQGYFVCTECRKKKFMKDFRSEREGRGRTNKKKIIIPVVIVGIFLIFIMNIDTEISIDSSDFQEQLEDISKNLPIKVEEQLKKIGEDNEILNEAGCFLLICDIEKLEFRVHELVNEERKRYGLSQLSWDPTIAKIARAHSEDMSTRNYYQHTSPEGKEPWDRGYPYGYQACGSRMQFAGLSENIMYMEGYSGHEIIAKNIVNGWMNSPGHKENILTDWKKEGIGIVLNSNGEIYATQNFC